MTIMGIVAERHGWDLSRASLSVNKVMASEPVRRIARLEVEIRLPGEFDARARTALEKAALSCPVHATLGASVEMPVAFHWDE
ncbi:MAG: putative redox protein [Planctomycetota bacterium]